MFTLENNVGRLCEIFTDSTLSLGEMTAFRARLATVFQSIPARAVICSDLRRCGALADPVVAGLITIGRIDNPKIERHALVVTPGQILAEQMQAVVSAAGNPNRRTFGTAVEARAWLREVLTVLEGTRLNRFLEEH